MNIPKKNSAFDIAWVPAEQLSAALAENESLRMSLESIRRVTLQETDPQIIARRPLSMSKGAR